MNPEAGFFERHSNVYLYVPNLIGYARVVSAVYAYAVALHSPVQAVAAYFFGFICDYFDGLFARAFHQTSTLGAVFDMVTDRVATTGLLAILCMLYPRIYLVFLLLLSLDIFSHWFQMYSTLVSGAVTHKDINSRSFIVRAYYKHRPFMGLCCISCEVLYLALYLLHFPALREWALVDVRLPPLLSPPLQGLYQFLGWGRLPRGGLPLVLLLALASLFGCAVKQVVNVVQLQVAMARLVAYDRAREQATVSKQR